MHQRQFFQELQLLLDFLKDSTNLKTISRQGWIDKLSIKNPESVADHSYSMAIMAMIISDLENYDSEKNALFSSPKGFRKTRLSDIYKRNISSFTSALLATLIGGLSLIIVNGNFIEIPSWFWFACFLFTAFPIHALVWGIAIQSGVLNYDKNSKHGVK